ncbi:NAD-dependent epimerase/dehydratase family protein, partial [Brachybacterium alimentarium]|uniref:NAD-dependent epimerase/dehydratase family protein n=1 Tax=Brachybacterium alimentarium TaxID=47845 RepID=UPI003FD3938D
MKIVVTGGSGFLGSHLVQYLLDEGHQVAVVDTAPIGSKGVVVDAPLLRGDIRDQSFISSALAGAEEVYHLAGILGTSELQQT